MGGFLSDSVWGIIMLGIGVGIAMNVLSSIGSSLTGTASTAVNTTTTSINTNVVGNYGLIALIVVFVFILGLVAMMRKTGGGGNI